LSFLWYGRERVKLKPLIASPYSNLRIS